MSKVWLIQVMLKKAACLIPAACLQTCFSCKCLAVLHELLTQIKFVITIAQEWKFHIWVHVKYQLVAVAVPQAAAVLEAAVMLQRCGTQECLQRGKFLPVLQESLAAVQVRLRACDGTPLATEGPSMQSSTGEKNEFAQESAARPQTAADVRYLAGLISQLHAAENALMQALLAP